MKRTAAWYINQAFKSPYMQGFEGRDLSGWLGTALAYMHEFACTRPRNQSERDALIYACRCYGVRPWGCTREGIHSAVRQRED